MQTLPWRLNRKGFEMTRDNFDINKFAAALSGLLGEGAEPVMGLVYQNLCRHLKVDPAADPDTPARDRINKILEVKDELDAPRKRIRSCMGA
ncbi:MAG: hypothetical protein ACREAW_03200 [Nitrososphaera sp.]